MQSSHISQRIETDPGTTLREHEQRALTLATLVLIIGFVVLFGAISFATWAYATNSHFFHSTDETALFVLSVIVASLHALLVILAFIAGIVAVVWFACWVSARSPGAQSSLLAVLMVLLIIIAIGYFVEVLVGIALFVVRLTDNERLYIGWFGSLAAFIFVLLFLLVVIAARNVCDIREKTDSVMVRREVHHAH